jgi:hypothetical protein
MVAGRVVPREGEKIMKAKRFDEPQPLGGAARVANQIMSPTGASAARPLLMGTPQPDSGQPGGGRGRVDITGIVPEDIHVDPDLTEGHPGYDESGESEIIPLERFAGGGNAEDKAG